MTPGRDALWLERSSRLTCITLCHCDASKTSRHFWWLITPCCCDAPPQRSVWYIILYHYWWQQWEVDPSASTSKSWKYHPPCSSCPHPSCLAHNHSRCTYHNIFLWLIWCPGANRYAAAITGTAIVVTVNLAIAASNLTVSLIAK
jgi:hypothetical protein